MLALLPFWIFAVSGCGNAVATGTSTALSGYDLEAMAAQMAESIVADPQVQAAIANEGPLRVVIRPVRNELTGQVLPRGQAQAFTAQVRTLLARARTGNFVWINNRDDFYAMRARELEGTDLGPAPDAVDPNYALVATFRSLTSDDKHGRSDFYQAIFQLTDLMEREVLWTDAYNVKKTASRNFLD
jgi:hypothetical protein